MRTKQLTSVEDVWRALADIDHGTALVAQVDLNWGDIQSVHAKAGLIDEFIQECGARGAQVVPLHSSRVGCFPARRRVDRCAAYPIVDGESGDPTGVREPKAPLPVAPYATEQVDIPND